MTDQSSITLLRVNGSLPECWPDDSYEYRGKKLAPSVRLTLIARRLRLTSMQISEDALFMRVNSRLGEAGHVLRRSRDVRQREGLGEYYIVDFAGDFSVSQDIDIVSLAHDMGVLASGEQLAGRG